MIRSGKALILFIVVLVCLPLLATGAVKKHPAVSEDQECAECHVQQHEAWQSGKHNPMGVPCVVCHGSLDATFFVRPPMERCAGCHADKVKDLTAMKTTKPKTCTTCHDKHTLTATTKAPFHSKGGK